jgi:hypothetical protein
MKFKQALHLAAIVAVLVTVLQAGSKFKVLHDFGSSRDGTIPYGPLLLDKEGKPLRRILYWRDRAV